MANDDKPPVSPPRQSAILPPKKAGPKSAPWVVAVAVAIIAIGVRQGLRSSARSASNKEPEVVSVSPEQADEAFAEIEALNKKVDGPDSASISAADMKTEIGKLYADVLAQLLTTEASRASLLSEAQPSSFTDAAALADDAKRQEAEERFGKMEKAVQDYEGATQAASFRAQEFVKSLSGGVEGEPLLGSMRVKDASSSYVLAVRKLLDFAAEKQPDPTQFGELASKAEGWLDNWQSEHENNISEVRKAMMDAVTKLKSS